MIASLTRWWRRRAPGADASAPAPVPQGPRKPSLPPLSDELLQATRRATLQRLRAPVREVDQTLALETRLWSLRLPVALQPRLLERDFPRVANRVARAWTDPQLLDPLFDDLLHDRRGDRRGFAAPVATELRRLRQFALRQRLKAQPAPAPAAVERPEFTRGDTFPMELIDDPRGIDWTPTETIVVRSGH